MGWIIDIPIWTKKIQIYKNLKQKYMQLIIIIIIAKCKMKKRWFLTLICLDLQQQRIKY